MSNEWYNPYDPNIQWGNGLADLMEAFGPQLKKLLGIGGSPAQTGPAAPAMGAGGNLPVGPGGGGQKPGLTPYTMGGGSPAQFMGGQQGGGQLSPDVERILAAIMQAMAGRPNI